MHQPTSHGSVVSRIICLWKRYSKEKHWKFHVSRRFVFLEHSRSWSAILQLSQENIFKQESLQNPCFYSWSILEVGQWFGILVGKHIQTRITSKPTFLFMEHSQSCQLFCNSCGKTYSYKNHFKPTFYSWNILVVSQWFCNSCGKYFQTRITSKPTFLFVEHSRSCLVILKFLWENIFMHESLQNPRFYSWSMLEVGLSWVVLNSVNLRWVNLGKVG